MSFSHAHALDDYIAGFTGTPNPHHLAILKRPLVFSVLAHAGHESSVEEALAEIAEVSVRFCGPGEWLLVAESIAPETLIRDLALLSRQLSFVDQSEGRVVMRLSGPRVRNVLAKCAGLDLHPDQFDLGGSANTLCCHTPANLARTGVDEFEITVMRSYAGYVFDEIVEMGREFAMTAGFAG